MTGYRPMMVLVAFVLASAFTSSSYAAERKCWRHNEGYFENVKDDQWEEMFEKDRPGTSTPPRTRQYTCTHHSPQFAKLPQAGPSSQLG